MSRYREDKLSLYWGTVKFNKSLCTFLANNFSACFENLDKYVFSEGDSVDLPSETAHGIEAYHVAWPAVGDTMDPEVMVDVSYPLFQFSSFVLHQRVFPALSTCWVPG
jgi:hypothetical protein